MTASIVILCISTLALSVGANFCSDKVNGTYSIPGRPCSIQFYYCSNHLQYVYDCPDKANQLYYNAATAQCDYPNNIHGCAGLTTRKPTERPTPVTETWPPTTLAPTTLAPTTLAPTTLAPTTLAPTTLAPTTLAPTTLAPTTLAPTTLAPTTLAPTTLAPTTLAPTTLAPTTLAPTTLAPTTLAPTTLAPTTLAPTTLAPTTLAPTILTTTTQAPTTTAPTTLAPTTLPTTTVAPTTAAPTDVHPITTTTVAAPTVVTPTGGHGTCIGKVNGTYALPGNPCSELFYMCSDGILSSFHCAAPSVPLYWNDVKKQCDYAYNIPACSGH